MSRDDHQDEVRFETELDAPPEKVWRALTVPEFVSRWLAPNDINPEEGHAFRLKGEAGDVECEIVEASPPDVLSYSWREEGGPDSLVSFRLTGTEAGGTRLTIVHGRLARPALPTLRVAGTRISLGTKRAGTSMSFADTAFALAA